MAVDDPKIVQAPVPAHVERAVLSERRTQLGSGPEALHTVEHVLAAGDGEVGTTLVELVLHADQAGHGLGLDVHEAPQIMRGNNQVLEPGMVISMEPMLTIPDGQPGAGGYREHDILFITEDGNEDITKYPYGPDFNVVG